VAAPTQRATLLAVASGGALGASARYLIGRVVHVAPGSFPWRTFWVNVSGSFLLGFLMVLLVERFPPNRWARPFLATGFLGAYTTFSTFAVEADLLGNGNHMGMAITYVLASLLVGLAAVFAGVGLARAWAWKERP
jgi:CrcB protein